MRIGFHVFYRNDEATRAVIRLAEFIRARGHEAAIHSPIRPARVSPRWDHEVVTENSLPVAEWFKTCRAVIWPEAPGTTVMSWAARAGCKTILLSPWDHLTEEAKACHQQADLVVSPSRQGAHLFHETWALANCRHIPWDVGIPLTRQEGPVQKGKIRLVFTLQDDQAQRSDSLSLHLINNILCRVPRTEATLLYNPRAWTVHGHQLMQRIRKRFGHRLQAFSDRDLTNDDILMQYGRSDLTVWLSEYEGLASIGLESLAMGTPVFGYDVSPQTEFLFHDRNAYLVPCELKLNWFGAPVVQANLFQFEEDLYRLVTSQDQLDSLRCFTRLGMTDRRVGFETGWSSVLGLR